MAKKKTPGGTAGKGGVNPAPTRDDQTVRIAAEKRAQFVWELSDREKALVKSLGKHGGAV